LEKNRKKRINIAKKYIQSLSKLEIEVPPISNNFNHIFHKFVIKTKKRDELFKYLKRKGIEVLIHYKKPISELKVFRRFKNNNPNAISLSKHSLSLPIHPYLSNKEIVFIIQNINEFFKNIR